MQRMLPAILLVLTVSPISLGQSAPAAATTKPLAMSFPHAGLTLSLPTGFERTAKKEFYDVVRATKKERGIATIAVTVSAFPSRPDLSLEMFANAKFEQLKGNLMVRHLEVSPNVPMPVSTVKGMTNVLSYTYRGTATVAVQLFFTRETPEPASVVYLVTIEAEKPRQAELLSVLGEVVKTIRLIDIKHPYELPVSELGEPQKERLYGYAARPPVDWFVVQQERGLAFAQCDYLSGGAAIPMVQLIAMQTQEYMPAQLAAEQAVEAAVKAGRQKDVKVELLSQYPSALDGRKAHDFILREVAPPGEKGQLPPLLTASRVVTFEQDLMNPPMQYVVFVVARGASQQQIKMILNKIAEGYVLNRSGGATAEQVR